MSGDKYQCTRCKGNDISFLRIEDIGTAREEVIFFCHSCQKEFSIKYSRAEYLPNMVALLKERYPLKGIKTTP